MSRRLRRCLPGGRLVVPVVLGFALLGPDLADAQAPPQIAYLFPAGGQRGTTVPVSVRGRNLIGATAVHISGQGATGKVVAVEQPEAGKKQPARLDASANPHLARVEVTLAPDAEVGERDLRLLTPGGVSNRFRFFVGQVPEVNEAEPNSLNEAAQALGSLPIVVNGQIFQADRDIFRFQAQAGQTLVFEVQAQRILPYIADGVPGWFQSSLTLCDAQGRELSYVDDFRHHPDPVLFHKVERDGEYRVEIKDTLYRGRDDFVYRLSIGALPYLTHVFPLGARRNSKLELQLRGVNLPADRMTVELPVDCPARRSVQVTAQGFVSNTLPIAVDDLPQTAESEPNNVPITAQRIGLPTAVDGRIGCGGDVDNFVFAAKAKERLVMDVLARRLDSPLDSLLTLFDSKGRQLAENDDTIDNSEGLVTHHADSYLAFTFPADGDYVLRIMDVQGHGGDEYAYRLTVAPPRLDFLLRIRPDNPRAPQGGTTVFTVTAFRRDGFNGEIKLAVKGVPEGFVAPDVAIPEKQNAARMTITVPPGAPIGILGATVVGTARVGDQEIVREAVPAEEIMQAFYYMHNIPTKEFLLAVVESGPFTLALDLPPGETLKIPARGRVEVAVKAAFKPGIKGAINLRADAPPRGFQVQVPPIAEGQDQTKVTVTTIGQEVNVGQTGNLIIIATMRVGNQTISGFVPAIPFQVVP